MAVRLSVSDLCLGKPALRSLSAAATVADTLAALKSAAGDTAISVWSCDHAPPLECACVCVGKVCMVDIVCFLCGEEKNLASPGLALKSPVSVLLPKVEGLVRHVDPSSSLLEATDLILQGAQNLVVPIKTSNSRRKQLQKTSSPSSICTTHHNGQEFCWLTQEDVIRFLLTSISLFSPIPSLSIDALGVISREILTVEYHRPALSAIGSITRSLMDQTSVAVIDNDGTLIGEISPCTLSCCDETVGAAIATLSAGDLMAYIDCGGPPEEIVRVVEARLRERKLEGMLKEFYMTMSPYIGDAASSFSSDEELAGPTKVLSRSGSYSRFSSHSARVGRMGRTAEAIMCYPGSSLVAVMIQAIVHRVNCVWVIEEDYSVVGIVTFANMLRVFRESLKSMISDQL